MSLARVRSPVRRRSGPTASSERRRSDDGRLLRDKETDPETELTVEQRCRATAISGLHQSWCAV